MAKTKRHDAHNGTHRGDSRSHDADSPTAGPPETAPPHPDETAETAASDRMKRAEEMVDRVAMTVGMYTSVVGRKALQWAAAAREGVEDMWAEAQAIRTRNRPARSGEAETGAAEPLAAEGHPHRR